MINEEERNDKPKILVVDDNAANVDLLEAYLQASDYRVLKAYNGREGLEMTYKHMPDLILLDIMMPGIDGYEVCRKLKEDGKTRLIPIVIITALSELEDKIRGLDVGADDFLSKPFNRLELMARVRSLLRIKRLHDDLDSSENIIFTLALALEAKDPYTKGHSERVAELSRRLAEEIGLPPESRERLYKAGILHDIGKIGIRESILNKKEKLDDDEYGEVVNHSSIGANICDPLRSLADIIPVIRHHHERWDGSGNPDGLAGEEIPLGSRIISITDTYDAMTSERPYRAAMKSDVALRIMESEIDTGQWDPRLLRIFIKMMSKGGGDG